MKAEMPRSLTWNPAQVQTLLLVQEKEVYFKKKKKLLYFCCIICARKNLLESWNSMCRVFTKSHLYSTWIEGRWCPNDLNYRIISHTAVLSLLSPKTQTGSGLRNSLSDLIYMHLKGIYHWLFSTFHKRCVLRQIENKQD